MYSSSGTNIYAVVDESHSFIGQLLLCSSDNLNPLGFCDVAFKLDTGRGDILA